MALQYENTNPYNLPLSAQKVIPQELGQDFLATLGRSMDVSDQKQMNDLLGFQESRGLLKSGDTNRRLVQDVLGPSEDRRNQALLGIAVPAAQLGEQQQFQTDTATTLYGRQKEMEQLQFQQQLQEMQQQYEFQRQLMILNGQISDQNQPGFGSMFMDSLGRGLGSGVSGSIMGGFGGALGGLGKSAPVDEYSAYWGSLGAR